MFWASLFNTNTFEIELLLRGTGTNVKLSPLETQQNLENHKESKRSKSPISKLQINEQSYNLCNQLT